jgi:hypothetical protein
MQASRLLVESLRQERVVDVVADVIHVDGRRTFPSFFSAFCSLNGVTEQEVTSINSDVVAVLQDVFFNILHEDAADEREYRRRKLEQQQYVATMLPLLQFALDRAEGALSPTPSPESAAEVVAAAPVAVEAAEAPLPPPAGTAAAVAPSPAATTDLASPSPTQSTRDTNRRDSAARPAGRSPAVTPPAAAAARRASSSSGSAPRTPASDAKRRQSLSASSTPDSPAAAPGSPAPAASPPAAPLSTSQQRALKRLAGPTVAPKLSPAEQLKRQQMAKEHYNRLSRSRSSDENMSLPGLNVARGSQT